MRRSKMGPIRAAVLIGIHVLIAAHIAHWWVTGSTLSPLEPSEGMEFSKHGLINAGLIFFVVMILSTMIFGRFFCGWGCHLVALQDGSRWLLGKFGIKPRPFKSRLLIFVPILAFVYMFLYPLAYWIWRPDRALVTGTALTKSAFWETFPGWGVAVFTFVVCGFVIIYLLGAKGFCTYGCPYGGIFGLVDKAAPLRIRVTDACEHCGHCTAVCSSNVRVHEEVRDFGAVVDPGCMKCMDCVSVCPNDALYLGFGAPAMLTKPRGEKKRAARSQYTWSEELLLGVLFVGALFAFRGLYGLVPFLLSLGLAAIVAYLGVQGLRLVYQPSVSIGRWGLKRAERVTGVGVVFVVLMIGLLAFWVHSGLIQYHDYAAKRSFSALSNRQFAHSRSADSVEEAAMLGEAIGHSEFVHRWSLVPTGTAAERLAALKRYSGDFDAFERLMAEAIALEPGNSAVRIHLADELAASGRLEEAVAWYRRAVEAESDSIEAIVKLGQSLAGTGKGEEAVSLLERASSERRASADLPYNLGVLHTMAGRVEEAERCFREALERRPGHLEARENLAGVLCSLGKFEEGISQFRLAIEENPDDGETHALMALALERVGRLDEAREHMQAAASLAPERQEFGAMLARMEQSTSDKEHSTGPTIEQEVRSNILDQQMGSVSLRALHLPDAFVDRLVDRIIRSSYQHRFHKVVGGVDAEDKEAATNAENEYLGSATGMSPRVVRLSPDAADAVDWNEFQQGRPDRVDFSVPLFGNIPNVTGATGFHAAADSGNRPIKMIRLQWPRGDYWQSRGDGGPLHVSRQLIEAIPDAEVFIGIEESHLSSALKEVRTWGDRVASRITFVPQPVKIEQWARDNGIAGSVQVDGANSAPATLVPRFSSIRDDGSEFVPGETAAGYFLSAASMKVVQSPLIFQGGNLLVAEHPVTGERILLIGEAEVWRNTAMGMSEGEVLDAFGRALSVDRVVLLPALSFHIDLDVSVRAHEGKLIAFVNEPVAGAKIAARCGLPALVRAGALTNEEAAEAESLLSQNRIKEFLGIAGAALARSVGSSGFLTESFAKHFSVDGNDSGVGNLQRFQLAMDILSCEAIPIERWPDHDFTSASVRAYQRRKELRAAFHDRLRAEGFAVVAIPGLVDADRAINYVNALHEPGRMYVSTYGGLFAGLDEAALGAIGDALGPSVEVIGILCGESQRRFGGIHCAASVYSAD